MLTPWDLSQPTLMTVLDLPERPRLRRYTTEVPISTVSRMVRDLADPDDYYDEVLVAAPAALPTPAASPTPTATASPTPTATAPPTPTATALPTPTPAALPTPLLVPVAITYVLAVAALVLAVAVARGAR